MDDRDVLRRVLLTTVVVVATAGAVAWRLTNHRWGLAPPNVELVTSATLTVALAARSSRAAAMPLVVVAVTDALIGNSAVWVFTWSAWLVVGVVTVCCRRTVARRPVVGGILCGWGASTWFYLWTNLGVWWQGRGAFYPQGLDGLVASYVAGVPFYRSMVVANVLLCPLAACAVGALGRWWSTGRVPAPGRFPGARWHPGTVSTTDAL